MLSITDTGRIDRRTGARIYPRRWALTLVQIAAVFVAGMALMYIIARGGI